MIMPTSLKIVIGSQILFGVLGLLMMTIFPQIVQIVIFVCSLFFLLSAFGLSKFNNKTRLLLMFIYGVSAVWDLYRASDLLLSIPDFMELTSNMSVVYTKIVQTTVRGLIEGSIAWYLSKQHVVNLFTQNKRNTTISTTNISINA